MTSHNRPAVSSHNGAAGIGLESFDYQPRTRVVFGPGHAAELGTLVRELGVTRVLVVTDRGIVAAGHVSKALDVLHNAGLVTAVFDDVHQNPTTDDVARGLAVARAFGCDGLVGLGGGSSMDCCKGINFLLTNGGRMEDYWGTGKASKPMVPMVAVPTTAGTGSDAQSYALIAQADTHVKMACGDPKAAFRVAVLDPELTVSMPVSVTAVTGIDAISHAIESYVTTRRNPISQHFSRWSWQLLHQGIEPVLKEPGNLAARGQMLLGSHLAGAAIENSMLGAAHACANPLTARFETTHGVAVAVMLPHVVRFNASVVGPLYGDLASAARLCDRADPNAPELLARRLTGLIASAGLPTTLRECEVSSAAIPDMAELAARQWTGTFNPRPVTVPDFVRLYSEAMG